MKIGFVYDVIYPETIGGVEKRIFEIGTRLSERGDEVHLFGMKFWDGPDIITRDGLVLHGVCRRMGIYTEGRRSILQALWYSSHLLPVLIQADLELIDCQNFPYFSVFVAKFVSIVRGIPLVISWHEFWGSYWFEYLRHTGIFGYLVERLALRVTPHAVAVSSLTCRQMKDAGYSGEIHISPNGITLSEMRDVKPSASRSEVLFAGRFIPEKHPELVVAVMRLLSADYPTIRCIMIGDGPEYPAVVRMISDEDLGDTIRCTGFIHSHDELISLMKSSRVLLLPSVREGFGITALEAMASGLAVVTVHHPRNAAAALVKPGFGYVAELNAQDLATGVRRYLVQGPDYEEMSRYTAEHDWDQITTDLRGFYRLLFRSRTHSLRIPEIPLPV